jgi:hypothetical protein
MKTVMFDLKPNFLTKPEFGIMEGASQPTKSHRTGAIQAHPILAVPKTSADRKLWLSQKIVTLNPP